MQTSTFVVGGPSRASQERDESPSPVKMIASPPPDKKESFLQTLTKMNTGIYTTVPPGYRIATPDFMKSHFEAIDILPYSMSNAFQTQTRDLSLLDSKYTKTKTVIQRKKQTRLWPKKGSTNVQTSASVPSLVTHSSMGPGRWSAHSTFYSSKDHPGYSFHLTKGFVSHDEDLTQTWVCDKRNSSQGIAKHLRFSRAQWNLFYLDARELLRVLALNREPHTVKTLEIQFRRLTGRKGVWRRYAVSLEDFLRLFPRTFVIFGGLPSPNVRRRQASQAEISDGMDEVMARFSLLSGDEGDAYCLGIETRLYTTPTSLTLYK
uniref:Uncharacterized protein n=1 Tax=Chromera velia CCMP2878 TaxID=1169474 RepID=A0A0G4HIC5_9ALVE|eukprot:Cvel_6953.t1-p1 / transcript=Cvel_6953.t1 / gene=Cvel_6953 / organism=Chromera_velia_CCMP2878 / gene_product=hypothetical protein / transcript_product=hypothetical protein / location=Cvel_scaffold352:77405-78358(+) / protein_length=318 / sequence_SO=supercontig / SO=protein_coding / is_pseudo=false